MQRRDRAVNRWPAAAQPEPAEAQVINAARAAAGAADAECVRLMTYAVTLRGRDFAAARRLTKFGAASP